MDSGRNRVRRDYDPAEEAAARKITEDRKREAETVASLRNVIGLAKSQAWQQLRTIIDAKMVTQLNIMTGSGDGDERTKATGAFVELRSLKEGFDSAEESLQQWLQRNPRR